jgi:hypothetical protein
MVALATEIKQEQKAQAGQPTTRSEETATVAKPTSTFTPLPSPTFTIAPPTQRPEPTFTRPPSPTPTPTSEPTLPLLTPTPAATRIGKRIVEVQQLPQGKAGYETEVVVEPVDQAGVQIDTSSDPIGKSGRKVTTGQVPADEREAGKGQVVVELRDADGKAEHRLFIASYDPEQEEWEDVYTADSDWKLSVSLAPGLYKLRALYRETTPQQWRDLGEFEIAEGTQVSVTDYFERGQIEVALRDADGKAEHRLFIARYDPEQEEWEDVYTADSDWKLSVSLAPGLYKLRALYRETTPQQWRDLGEFEIAEGTQVSVTDYFERGQIEVVLRDADGKAEHRLFIARYDPEQEEWEDVYTADSDWKLSVSLAPGLYKLRALYYETEPRQHWDLGQITVSGGEIFQIENTEIMIMDTTVIPGAPEPPTGKKLQTNGGKSYGEQPYIAYQEFFITQVWEIEPDDPELDMLDEFYDTRLTANGWKVDTQANTRLKMQLRREDLWAPDSSILNYQNYYTDVPDIPQPVYNDSVVARQLSITYNREAKQLVLRYAEQLSPEQEPYLAYREIKTIVEDESLSEQQKRERLTEMERNFGQQVFLAALRLLPVYDLEDGSWKTLDAFTRQAIISVGGDPTGDSRLERDPLGTGFDILFGDALEDTDKLLEIIGFEVP